MGFGWSSFIAQSYMVDCCVSIGLCAGQFGVEGVPSLHLMHLRAPSPLVMHWFSSACRTQSWLGQVLLLWQFWTPIGSVAAHAAIQPRLLIKLSLSRPWDIMSALQICSPQGGPALRNWPPSMAGSPGTISSIDPCSLA